MYVYPRTLLAPPGGHRRRPAIASKFPKTGFEPRWQGPSERPQGIWDLANKNTGNFLPCSPRPLKFWKQRAKMWEREKSPEKGKGRSWLRGLAARTVRPEPLGPNRSSSAERPRELNLFFPFSPSKRFPLSPSPRALRAPRAGHVRHATTRTRVCHSAHHVAANQLANRV